MTGPVRVLVVDDSEVCRATLKALFESDPQVEVVGVAKDGLEALEQLESLKPSLITLDLDMPRLNGLETIEQAMRRRPTPILVVTDRPQMNGRDMLFACLARGALDLVPKGEIGNLSPQQRRTLLARVKELARAPARVPSPPRSIGQRQRALGGTRVVGIGASTGGPQALAEVLRLLPVDYRTPVIVVQHIDDYFHDDFVQWLAAKCKVKVHSAAAGEVLTAGTVLIAPPKHECTISADGRVKLTAPRAHSAHVPSVNALFHSLADGFGPEAAGVVLTGMGADGALGLRAVHQRGGLTVVQDEQTSVVHGMPSAAIAVGAAELVLPLGEIGSLLVDLHTQGMKSAVRDPRRLVLIIDDSQLVLHSARLALEQAGFRVVTADNPFTLPALVHKHHIDLALVDLSMPALDGDVVVKLLAQMGSRKMRAVLFSDQQETELDRRARKAGVLGYIKKGDLQHLVNETRRFLEMPVS
jgi:two-component system chemotaxis response regulator CheB